MGRNETKAKPTAWNIGQFRVIRPRIQRIARQAVDEAVRGPFQVKQSTEEKIPRRPVRPSKGEIDMCYNCGCGMPNNDMGNPANVTNKTFEEAAKAMRQSSEDAKRNARQLLEKVINSKEQSNDKNWKP
jgi:hypothetical protein